MYLGIEIGGTKLQLGIGPGDGTLRALWRGTVDVAAGPEGIRRQITAAVPELLSTAGLARSELRGAGVAIRHSYLQHNPPLRETCGTDLEFLLNTFSLSEAFPKIFAGTGSCSKVDWKFLGLSIPEWSLVWYIAFACVSLWVAFRRDARARA